MARARSNQLKELVIQGKELTGQGEALEMMATVGLEKKKWQKEAVIVVRWL